MSLSQKKIIGCIILAGFCGIVEAMTLMAIPRYKDNDVVQVEMPYGTFDIQQMSQDKFTQLKWSIFGIALIVEVISVVMLVQALNNKQI